MLPHPPPHPQSPPPKMPEPPPQQDSRISRKIMLQPLPPVNPVPHPVPQFVAVKSLIEENPPFFIVYNTWYVAELALFPFVEKKIIIAQILPKKWKIKSGK